MRLWKIITLGGYCAAVPPEISESPAVDTGLGTRIAEAKRRRKLNYTMPSAPMSQKDTAKDVALVITIFMFVGGFVGTVAIIFNTLIS